MNNPNVMHLTSTMLPGGAERVAINILNNLEAHQFTPFLVTSREDGPLLANLSNRIKRTCLQRKFRFDFNGFLRLMKFIRHHHIHIIHAHENTIFLALMSKLIAPGIIVIWHNHMSSMLNLSRVKPWYLLAGRAADFVLVANTALANWTIEKIGISADKVRYIPNFVDSQCLQKESSEKEDFLKINKNHKRIVCVGNIRPEKDQITLLKAFRSVVESIGEVHLILVGQNTDKPYSILMNKVIKDLGIINNISVMGTCSDVSPILTRCDVGVLSSKSEAFPMVLMEYGCAKLPSIATSVGQCPEILDYGRAGVLIAPNSPEHLAKAIIQLLESPRQMNDFGQRLYDRVKSRYSPEVVMPQYKILYTELLMKRKDND